MKIKNFEEYDITETGNVIRNGKTLKGGVDRHGYRLVTLCSNGIRKTAYIHRLVAEYFIPNPYDKPVVNHLNGDKLDNRKENLEWTDVSGNTRHAYQIGKMTQSGEKNNAAKYSDALVKEIISGYDGGNMSEYAKKFDVPYATVRSYLKKERRAEGSTTIPRGSTPKQVEAHSNNEDC